MLTYSATPAAAWTSPGLYRAQRVPSGHCARPKDAALVLERMQLRYRSESATAGIAAHLLQLLLRILQRAKQVPEVRLDA